ncbi:uncharacterized protein EV154DRAFT_486978 [Mucor mucedo]|uniref:uncharacterized protein n=1 Tax=Mucor mucedo TaxID=29922 RepID=UPI00221F9530|nr:uncharacterized protein EV154DRAFT_486978 [Mucor mucedo]KAI7874191.1 hypothetical protein EV154DRAFT_486978 [Mucor mucedo]
MNEATREENKKTGTRTQTQTTEIIPPRTEYKLVTRNTIDQNELNLNLCSDTNTTTREVRIPKVRQALHEGKNTKETKTNTKQNENKTTLHSPHHDIPHQPKRIYQKDQKRLSLRPKVYALT